MPGRRAGRWLWVVGMGLGVALLLGVAAATWLPRWLARKAEAVAQRDHGVELVLTPPVLGLDGVGLGAGRARHPLGSVTWDEVAVRYRLGELLEGRVAAVDVRGLQVTVPPEALEPPAQEEAEKAEAGGKVEPTRIIREAMAQVAATLWDLPVEQVRVPGAQVRLPSQQGNLVFTGDVLLERSADEVVATADWRGPGSHMRVEVIARRADDATATMVATVDEPLALADQVGFPMAHLLSGAGGLTVKAFRGVEVEATAATNGQARLSAAIAAIDLAVEGVGVTGEEATLVGAIDPEGQVTARVVLPKGEIIRGETVAAWEQAEARLTPGEGLTATAGMRFRHGEVARGRVDLRAAMPYPLAANAPRGEARLVWREVEAQGRPVEPVNMFLAIGDGAARLWTSPLVARGIDVGSDGLVMTYRGPPLGPDYGGEVRTNLVWGASREPLARVEGTLTADETGKPSLAVSVKDPRGAALAGLSLATRGEGVLAARFEIPGNLETWEPLLQRVGAGIDPLLATVDLSGTAAVDGEAELDGRGTVVGSVRIDFEEVGVVAIQKRPPAPETRITLEGLTGTLAAVLDEVPRTQGPQSLRVGRVGYGAFEATHIEIEADLLSPEVLDIRKLGCDVLGGEVTLSPVALNPVKPDVSLRLGMRDIDAQALFDMIPDIGYYATGRLTGELPIRVTNWNPRVEPGLLLLQSTPPGRLYLRDKTIVTKRLGSLGDPVIAQQVEEALGKGLSLNELRVDLFTPIPQGVAITFRIQAALTEGPVIFEGLTLNNPFKFEGPAWEMLLMLMRLGSQMSM